MGRRVAAVSIKASAARRATRSSGVFVGAIVRIALITHIRSKIGGTESYVEHLAHGLHAAGHEIALWHEHNGAPERGMIALPAGSPSWSVESLGASHALAGLREWKPQVLFSHGVSTPAVETAILELGPTVMFAHAYHGACISGTKSRLSPTRMPCPRPLGGACLLHYFPRRCGGWSPITMARRYSLETGRRDLLHRYAAILTASSHMRMEYLKYGLPPKRVKAVGLTVSQRRDARRGEGHEPPPIATRDVTRVWRLLFVARLTALKGGPVLLDALSALRTAFAGRITLTIAGEGPERASLEAQAARLRPRLPDVDIRFAGWLGFDALGTLMGNTDLLVVPSVWPEPFGLVGPEAGAYGVPAAAFAVGGIPDWLREGENGHLAPGDPPTSRGLATAIVAALSDAGHHAKLCAGAFAQSRELDPARHVARIIDILESAVAGGGPRLAT